MDADLCGAGRDLRKKNLTRCMALLAVSSLHLIPISRSFFCSMFSCHLFLSNPKSPGDLDSHSRMVSSTLRHIMGGRPGDFLSAKPYRPRSRPWPASNRAGRLEHLLSYGLALLSFDACSPDATLLALPETPYVRLHHLDFIIGHKVITLQKAFAAPSYSSAGC